MYLNIREEVEFQILRKQAGMHTKREIALGMLCKGIGITDIAKYTDLPENEVRCLASSKDCVRPTTA